jgi:hypothetical protein
MWQERTLTTSRPNANDIFPIYHPDTGEYLGTIERQDLYRGALEGDTASLEGVSALAEAGDHNAAAFLDLQDAYKTAHAAGVRIPEPVAASPSPADEIPKVHDPNKQYYDASAELDDLLTDFHNEQIAKAAQEA